MPVYEYRCNACAREFEYQQRMVEDDKVTCEACGKDALERLISRTAFQFKGSGWYKDLYSSAKPESGGDKKDAGTGTASSPEGAASSTPAAATPSTTAGTGSTGTGASSGGSSGSAPSGGSSSGGSSSGGSSSGSGSSSGGGSGSSSGGSGSSSGGSSSSGSGTKT